MEHYARTTIIQSGIKIRRERTLNQSGEVSTGVGNTVMPNMVVVRMPTETNFIIIEAAEMLDVPAEKVADYVVVEMKEKVDMGAVVAQKKQMLRSRQVVSPAEGHLFQVVNGRIIIQQASDWLEKQAMVAGRVVSFVGDRGVIIETHGTLIQGVWSSGHECFGKLKVTTRSHNGLLTKDHINSELQGHILVAGRIERLEVLQLAAEAQIAGIVTGSMPAELCTAVLALDLPVILTDGIGKQNMLPEAFELLQAADGREASLFGIFDKSRGQRPEIIIPETARPNSEPISANTAVRVGHRVRLLRAPYVGQVGEIVELYSLGQILATGAKAQGADVQLDNGTKLFVPFANFDIII